MQNKFAHVLLTIASRAIPDPIASTKDPKSNFPPCYKITISKGTTAIVTNVKSNHNIIHMLLFSDSQILNAKIIF